MVADEWDVPTDAQYNFFNTQNWGQWVAEVLFDPFAKFPSGGETTPYLISDWSESGDTMSLSLRDEDVMWHNGDQVVAEDIVTQLTLMEVVEDPIWNYIDSAEAVDQKTVELGLTSNVNTDLLRLMVLKNRMYCNRNVFQSHRENWEDATTDDAREQVQGDLIEFSLEDPIGNGPFQIVDRNEQFFDMELVESHPAARNINFSSLNINFYSGNEPRWQAFRAGELSVGDVGAPPQVRESFPDWLVERSYNRFAGTAMVFQRDSEFGDLRLRKALGHLLNNQEITDRFGRESRVPVEHITGVFDNERWVPDLDSYSNYEGGATEATSLLNDAGYTKEGNTWMTPDGNNWSVEIMFPAGSGGRTELAEILVEIFDNFGINASPLGEENTTYWGQTIPNGDFTLALTGWGGSYGDSHPFYTLNDLLYQGTVASGAGLPDEVSVPMPIGNPDGSEQTINIAEGVEGLSKAGGIEESVAELTWVVNQTLPAWTILNQYGTTWYNSQNWEAPPEDDPLAHDYYWMLRQGKLSAKPV